MLQKTPTIERSPSLLQAARRAAEEAKRAMRQNAEVARARLAGEVEQARAQQAALQNQFGAVDQRAVKKMNAEKRVSALTIRVQFNCFHPAPSL